MANIIVKLREDAATVEVELGVRSTSFLLPYTKVLFVASEFLYFCVAMIVCLCNGINHYKKKYIYYIHSQDLKRKSCMCL